jgi:hypothetical protein
VTTRGTPSAIVAGMTRSRAQTLFREAVQDLADEPTPVNVQRYLAASQILERVAQAESTPRAAGKAQRATLALEQG